MDILYIYDQFPSAAVVTGCGPPKKITGCISVDDNNVLCLDELFTGLSGD
jgi:hypothetical protein